MQKEEVKDESSDKISPPKRPDMPPFRKLSRSESPRNADSIGDSPDVNSKLPPPRPPPLVQSTSDSTRFPVLPQIVDIRSSQLIESRTESHIKSQAQSSIDSETPLNETVSSSKLSRSQTTIDPVANVKLRPTVPPAPPHTKCKPLNFDSKTDSSQTTVDDVNFANEQMTSNKKQSDTENPNSVSKITRCATSVGGEFKIKHNKPPAPFAPPAHIKSENLNHKSNEQLNIFENNDQLANDASKKNETKVNKLDLNNSENKESTTVHSDIYTTKQDLGIKTTESKPIESEKDLKSENDKMKMDVDIKVIETTVNVPHETKNTSSQQIIQSESSKDEVEKSDSKITRIDLKSLSPKSADPVESKDSKNESISKISRVKSLSMAFNNPNIQPPQKLSPIPIKRIIDPSHPVETNKPYSNEQKQEKDTSSKIPESEISKNQIRISSQIIEISQTKDDKTDLDLKLVSSEPNDSVKAKAESDPKKNTIKSLTDTFNNPSIPQQKISPIPFKKIIESSPPIETDKPEINDQKESESEHSKDQMEKSDTQKTNSDLKLMSPEAGDPVETKDESDSKKISIKSLSKVFNNSNMPAMGMMPSQKISPLPNKKIIESSQPIQDNKSGIETISDMDQNEITVKNVDAPVPSVKNRGISLFKGGGIPMPGMQPDKIVIKPKTNSVSDKLNEDLNSTEVSTDVLESDYAMRRIKLGNNRNARPRTTYYANNATNDFDVAFGTTEFFEKIEDEEQSDS